MGIVARVNFYNCMLLGMQLLWALALNIAILVMFSADLDAKDCGPGNISDCKNALQNGAHKNPLIPIAGAVTGIVARAVVRGRRQPGQPRDGKKTEPQQRLQNPWTGKPLTVWEPGRFGVGEDGNPGEPGMVWWGGNWVTPDDAREAIAKSLAADQRRTAQSEEFAKKSEELSGQWMSDRVKQLEQEAERERQEAERERQEKQAREDAWKALRNIEDIANRHGYENVWRRAQENAFGPDGSIDVDYVNRLRETLRKQLVRDQAAPIEPPQSWIAEGLSNTWNDFRHNPIVRIGTGVLSGGASEIFFQSQGAYEAMQASFNEAADRGRPWDLTDSVRSGYGRFLRENLPLNTIEALRNPNATWGQVAMGAGMDVFTGFGLRNTVNNLRGSLNSFRAGDSAWNALTQGGSPRNPFRPTEPEGLSLSTGPEWPPGTFVGRGSGASGLPPGGPPVYRQYPPGTQLNPNANPPGQTKALPGPIIRPKPGALPPLTESNQEGILSRLFSSRGIPIGRSNIPPMNTTEDCGLAAIQGMMRDSGRAITNEQLRKAALATGNKLTGGTSGISLGNLLRLNGAAAGGGRMPGETPSKILGNLSRLLAEKKQVVAGVGKGDTAHWLRVESVGPGGLWVKFADPATGLTHITTGGRFCQMMQEGGNDVIVARWTGWTKRI